MTSWVVVQKTYSKMYLVSYTNAHRDVTDSVKHGMTKNAKTWISWEWNVILLRNKEFLNLCLRCHILRSYHFLAEVTFNINARNEIFLTFIFLHFDLCIFFNYLLRLNTNNKRHFITSFKQVCQTTNNLHNSAFPFYLSMFTKKDSIVINNENRKEF